MALKLLPGVDEREVIAALDRLLVPYGGFGAFGRDDHVSHRFLTDEIRQNQTFGRIMPGIFMGLAAFLLNILLSRVVSMQRDQIGVLKAFGHTHRAIAAHYVRFALVAVVAGSIVGVAGGVWLGSLVHGMYVAFYRFPVFRVELGPLVVPTAVGVTAAAALTGALLAVRRAYWLPPAVAMRAESPPNFRAGLLERLGALRALPVSTRIVARNLTRRPLRAGLTALGIGLAVAILVLVGYFREALKRIADVQYRLVQREDVSVVAHEVLAHRATFDLAKLPGVMRVESFRAVPVRLRSRHHSRRGVLLGFDHRAELRRLIGRDLRPVPLTVDGVTLTSRLAEILEVQPGESVDIEVLDGQRQKRTVQVSALVDELVGLSAYMDQAALARLLGEEGLVSGAWLNVDSDVQPALYRGLKRLPAVGGVSLRAEALRSFEKTVMQNMTIFTSVLVFFGVVAAVSVVYNAARIGLSERGRELASLRVLGYTRGEIAYVLLGEQALLTAVAIPVGYHIGYRLCEMMSRSLQWELIRFPLFISSWTYTFSFAVVAASAIASAAIVRRRLDRLDLVAVLKTRE